MMSGVRRLVARWLMATGVVVVTFALSATAADAKSVFQFSFSFNAPEGGFGNALAAAVDQSNGDVYVSDLGTSLLWKFKVDLEGQTVEPEKGFGSKGHIEVPGLPFQPTVDNYPSGGGDLFVPSSGGGTLTKFTANGEPVVLAHPIEGLGGPTGVGVDVNGYIYVAQLGGAVVKFDATGKPVNATGKESSENTIVSAPSQVRAIAVDSTGEHIYLATEAGAIQYNLSSGKYAQGVTFGEGMAVGVAIAPAQAPSAGDIFVESGGETFEYGPSANLLARFGGGAARLAVYGTASHTIVYAPNGGGGVVAYDSVNLPTGVTGAAKSITRTTAELCGRINPESETLAASYQFNYGTQTSYGSLAPASPVSIGIGEAFQEKCTKVEGLNQAETYHYQLVASNGEGQSPAGDESFNTLPAPASVDGQSTSLIEQTSAIVRGLINPEHSQSTFHIEYGTSTAYGSSIPLPDAAIGSGSSDVQIEEQLTALQAGTTYHYRIVATNVAGITQGPDETFTTAASTPPVIEAVGANKITQSSVTLSGTIDPQGTQTSYELDIGADTNYGTRVFGEAGSNHTPQAVLASFQGLAPGTTYHYRLLASNVYGTIYSEDHTFTTLEAPAGATLTAPLTPALLPIPTVTFPSTILTTSGSKSKKPASKKKKKKKKAKKADKAKNAREARRAGHAHAIHGRGK
jgi:hypothetical protein